MHCLLVFSSLVLFVIQKKQFIHCILILIGFFLSLVFQGFAESHAAKFCAEENMSEADTPTQVITLAFTGWTLWYVLIKKKPFSFFKHRKKSWYLFCRPLTQKCQLTLE